MSHDITPRQVEDALIIWRVHLSRARRTHTPEAHEALLKAEDRAYEAYQRIDTAFKAQVKPIDVFVDKVIAEYRL